MREFNFEEAKSGKPVCTRNGYAVRLLSFDRKDESGFCIVGLVSDVLGSEDESVETWDSKGFCTFDRFRHSMDLVMCDEVDETEE